MFRYKCDPEVMPVLSIRVDGGYVVEFPEGGGEVTRQVRSYYKTHVDKYLQEHAHFSLYCWQGDRNFCSREKL